MDEFRDRPPGGRFISEGSTRSLVRVAPSSKVRGELVVADADVEGVEELDQLVSFGGFQGFSQVWEAGELRLDLRWARTLRPRLLGRRFSVGDGAGEGVGLGAEFFDPPLRRLDDRVLGIVVLLEAKRLAVHRPLQLLLLLAQPFELGPARRPARPSPRRPAPRAADRDGRDRRAALP
jgi:hypothetical protein